MPDLSFQVEKAEVVPYAAVPLLAFKLRVGNADPEEAIQAVALRCQIRIEPMRRPYQATEQARLKDLFGEPERWSQTLRSMLWTHASVMVPPFTGSQVVDLQVPCTFDFNVAATKFFHGLEAGQVPLLLLFSGTVFYTAEDGALQVTQISWEKEVGFSLPVRVWQEMMDHYYPNSAWLRLHRDIFDRLHQYKIEHGLPTWEQTLERLLPPVSDASEKR